MFFFFKQKTAYEIKECDWSSDVCSSDLSIRKLNTTYIFIIFFMIVFMLLIMIEYYKEPRVVLTNKDNYEISIREKAKEVSLEDPIISDNQDTLLYIDGNKAFCFKLPSRKKWSDPRVMNGMMAYLENAGLETNKTNVESFLRWNPYKEILQCVFYNLKIRPYNDMLSCLDETVKESPYGRMLKSSYSTQIEFNTPDVMTVARVNLYP